MSQEINLIINYNEKTKKFTYEMATDESQCKPGYEIPPAGLQPLISCSTCSDNWAFKLYLHKNTQTPKMVSHKPMQVVKIKAEPEICHVEEEELDEPPEENLEVELPIEQVKVEPTVILETTAATEGMEEQEQFPSFKRSHKKKDVQPEVKKSTGIFAHTPQIRFLVKQVKKCYGNEAFHHEDEQAIGTKLYVTRVNDGGNVYVCNFDMRSLVCDICQTPVKDLTSFLRHRKLHFVEMTDTTCNACKVEFRNQAEITLHVLMCPKKDTIKPLHCKFCGEKQDSYKAQRQHEKFHVRGRPKWALKRREEKMCHLCPKVCSNQEQLKFHLRKCHDLDPFLCAHCPKKFGQRNLMRVHLVQCHFPHLANYHCEICKKVFCLQKTLHSHMSKTHNDTKEACSICGKLIKAHSMAQHLERQHTSGLNRKKFPCATCGKTFLTKAHADSHEISHLPQELWKFKCKFCGKAYPDKHNLGTHERIHENGPEHICNHCFKGFTTKQYLADHINLHTGAKPYSCKVCSKKFSDRGNLRFHLKNHEKQMGVKLTMTIDERRIMKQQGAGNNMFL